MTINTFVKLGVAATACCICGAGVGFAQNNSILIDQSVPLGSAVGNTLIVDQSGASNSLVAGAPSGQDFEDLVLEEDEAPLEPATIDVFNAGSPAVQFGSGNSASITLSGDNAVAGLNQEGDFNSAIIDVDGDGAFGSVFQNGNGNEAELLVSSTGAQGELIQLGDNNSTQLSVTGTPNAAVSFTLQGNGVSTTVPANVVSSNGGQVTIIQRQLNSFTSQ